MIARLRTHTTGVYSVHLGLAVLMMAMLAPSFASAQSLFDTILALSTNKMRGCPPAVMMSSYEPFELQMIYDEALAAKKACDAYSAAEAFAARAKDPQVKLEWTQKALAHLLSKKDYKRAVITGVSTLKTLERAEAQVDTEHLRLIVLRAVAAEAKEIGLGRESIWFEMALGLKEERLPTFAAFLEDFPNSKATSEVEGYQHVVESMLIQNEFTILDGLEKKGESWGVVTRLESFYPLPAIVASKRFPEVVHRAVTAYLNFAYLLKSGYASRAGEKWSNRAIGYFMGYPAGQEANRAEVIGEMMSKAEAAAEKLSEIAPDNPWMQKAMRLVNAAKKDLS